MCCRSIRSEILILMLGGAVIFMLGRDEKIIRKKIVEKILKATEQI